MMKQILFRLASNAPRHPGRLIVRSSQAAAFYIMTRFPDLFESIFLPIAGINIPILG